MEWRINLLKPLNASIEAILFASGDAVAISRLADVLNISTNEIECALNELGEYYDSQNSGLTLLRINDKAQLCSRPDYADIIRCAIESRKPPQLSPAALEVLTIIAYRQPVTRAYVEQLRGVDSGGTISNLIEKGLIAEAGRLDVIGKPILYCTTDTFLRTFSISSLSELPELPELTRDEQLQLGLENIETE